MKAYYKVHPGPTFDILDAHVTAHRKANDAAVDWAKKHKLPVAGINASTVFFEEGHTPDKGAWKKGRRGGYTPRTKTAPGKALFVELRNLPAFPSWFELVTNLTKGREVDIMKVNSTGTPGVIKNKSDAFYLLATDPYWLPEDRAGLEEIKASEYQAN